MSSVLIVGAGIAGDALAVMLDRAGWDVTVVEIAPELRSGGQTVDLRGDCSEVLAHLGLLEECREHLVDQRGLRWIDADGATRAEMPVTAFGGNGFVSTEELLRTDLARVIHAATGERTKHRWSDTVTGIEQDANGVQVTFRQHPAQRFDLVIGADGAHSRVRSLVFGPEEQYRRPLGLAHAWFTLQEAAGTPDVDGWFLMYNAPGRRVAEARPGHSGQQEVGLTFAADTLPPRGDLGARFALLERTFADMGWRTQEFLRAARTAPDFALDTYDQIVLDRWSQGRVILLGDSAWCASPLSGLGTALALRGAWTLAEALRTEGLETAARSYEAAMRPRAESARRMYPGRVANYAPRTARGITVMTAIMRMVQRRPFSSLLERGAANYGAAPESVAVSAGSR